MQSEIGFGKLETYVKLDKLGEVGPSGAGVSGQGWKALTGVSSLEATVIITRLPSRGTSR